MKFARQLAYINAIAATLIVATALSYDIWFRHKLAKFIVESQRMNLIVRDYRALSSEVSAFKDLFYKVEVRSSDARVLYDASTISPATFGYSLRQPIFSDRDERQRYADVLFHFDLLEPLITGLILSMIAAVLLTPLARRRLNALEVERVRARESELEKRFSTIAKQVAHDIRSPLSALRIAASTLPSTAHAQSDILKLAAERISKIADDLLLKERAYFETNRSLYEIVSEVIAEKRVEFTLRPHLTLTNEVPASNFKFEGDPIELSRALSNLINNAADSMESEGSIVIRTEQSADGIKLAVKDSGRGISPELLKNLGKRRVSEGKSGSGLGLTHAANVAKSVGGKLEIFSVVGVGTEVAIRVPRIRARAKPATDVTRQE